jgi:hypothetical protein
MANSEGNRLLFICFKEYIIFFSFMERTGFYGLNWGEDLLSEVGKVVYSVYLMFRIILAGVSVERKFYICKKVTVLQLCRFSE